MKVVIQRVSRACVTVITEDMRSERSIDQGLMVLVGVGKEDDQKDVDYLARKIVNLRIFSDEQGKMNLSVLDKGGQILVVSQFTLWGDTKKGNRPSFNSSAPPVQAIPLYEDFVVKLEGLLGKEVPTGEFGAHMEVDMVNEGPVTIMMDSKNP